MLKSYQAVYHVKPVEHDFSSFQTILLLFEWHIPWTNAQNMVFLDCTLMPTKWGIILTCMIMRLHIFNLLKIQAWFKFKVLSRKASGDANCNNKMFFHNQKNYTIDQYAKGNKQPKPNCSFKTSMSLKKTRLTLLPSLKKAFNVLIEHCMATTQNVYPL